jgi:ABC-type phosphate transport system substrate-binding protein
LSAVTPAFSHNRGGAMAVLCVSVLFLSVSSLPQTASAPPAVRPADPIPLVFVVNRKNPVDALSLAEVRMMLLGERSHWPNGGRITVVMRDPQQPERDAVIRLVCRMDDRDYTRTVLRAVFTAELQSAPKLLGTPAGVIRFIYNVPGAIGYIRASELDGSVKAVRLAGAPAAAASGFTLQIRSTSQ